jgi:hypothetical protein
MVHHRQEPLTVRSQLRGKPVGGVNSRAVSTVTMTEFPGHLCDVKPT